MGAADNDVIEAHSLRVQLVICKNASANYQHLCKKHVRIFLLNCIITRNQILQVNQFLSVRIVSVNCEDTDLLSLQQYVASSSTKISFRRHEHKENSGLLVKDIVDKQQLLGMLQSRLVASGAFFNSLADFIVSGIGKKETKKIHMSNTRTGILIQSDIGGGKSTLLKALHEIFGGVKSRRFNFRELEGKNRGDMEGTILTIFDDCIASACRLILIDDIDLLVKVVTAATSVSDLYFSGAVLHGIDSIIQKHNRENEESKIFIIATCTELSNVHPGLLQPYRLGDKKEILSLHYPSQVQRQTLIQSLISCQGLNVVWDRNPKGGAFPLELQHSSDSINKNIEDFSFELSRCTQGASIPDIISAFKECYQSSVSSSQASSIIQKSHVNEISKSIQLDKKEKEIDIVWVRASNLAQAIISIRPAAAHKYDIGSLLIGAATNSGDDGDGKESESSLVGIEAIQNRLSCAVLQPYASVDNKTTSRNKFINPSHCSGVLIHGPSGCGKSSVARWLAHSGRKHFKFLSVACADLVHKVVGESERRLSQVFAAAREMAPCFLLLDNLEIILGSGTEGSGAGTYKRTAHQALDRLLSTLLVEIDGLSSSRTLSKLTSSKNGDTRVKGVVSDTEWRPVVVIATTCDIGLIDRALSRPGRLEEHIAMEMPTTSQRTAMINHFHSKMVEQGEILAAGNISDDQREFIRNSKVMLDIELQKAENSELRSPGALKQHFQEAAMKIIKDYTYSAK